MEKQPLLQGRWDGLLQPSMSQIAGETVRHVNADNTQASEIYHLHCLSSKRSQMILYLKIEVRPYC